MSRQSHLPPRCPFQKKPIARPFQESLPHHHRYHSQGSILEEPPSWVDDLLSDQDANSKGIFHRRSASDSATLLDGIVDSGLGLNANDEEGNLAGYEVCSEQESTSMYGPNSPRQRSNLTFSENAIASALCDYVVQNPLQHVDGNLCISGNGCPQLMDPRGSVGETDAETTTLKRHSGQRSRVRKLQYIAELERIVNDLQTIESELAVKVASMLQKRVALSMENSKLKQKLARLRQEKSIMEGQYKSMKKEVGRLRNGLQNSSANTTRLHFQYNPPAETSRSNLTLQMLDMSKLNIN